MMRAEAALIKAMADDVKRGILRPAASTTAQAA
jgi:hypothetical protein